MKIAEVIDIGHTYDSYDVMAIKLSNGNTENWKRGSLPKEGRIYKVINIYDGNFNIEYYYIKDFETGQEYVIGKKGIRILLEEFIEKEEMII